jgi:hypothetical protein
MRWLLIRDGFDGADRLSLKMPDWPADRLPDPMPDLVA